MAFVEKPPPGEAPTNLVNAGTYVLEPTVLGRIPAGRRVSIERETFPSMVADGGLFAMATDDYWLDAGRPDLYRQANLDVIAGRRRHIRGEAWAATAEVDPSAEVRSSVVGDHAAVGAGAVVERSVLLPGAAVEPGAKVVDSILGVGAVAGESADLHDVVLGDGERVEPGRRLAAVRIPAPE